MEIPRILFAGSQSEKCFEDGHVNGMSGILPKSKERGSERKDIISTCKSGSQ